MVLKHKEQVSKIHGMNEDIKKGYLTLIADLHPKLYEYLRGIENIESKSSIRTLFDLYGTKVDRDKTNIKR